MRYSSNIVYLTREIVYSIKMEKAVLTIDNFNVSYTLSQFELCMKNGHFPKLFNRFSKDSSVFFIDLYRS